MYFHWRKKKKAAKNCKPQNLEREKADLLLNKDIWNIMNITGSL